MDFVTAKETRHLWPAKFMICPSGVYESDQTYWWPCLHRIIVICATGLGGNFDLLTI